MKEKDLKKAIQASEEKQLDMMYWKFTSHGEKATPATIKPIKIDDYNSSQVIATRFYKIIRF